MALGLLTLWPLFYMGLFFVFFMYMVFSMTRGRHQAPAPDLFLYIFPLHCCTILLIFVLTGVYVFHAYKTDRIPPDRRILWVVILLFGNMMAFPIYWYLYLWRSDTRPIE